MTTTAAAKPSIAPPASDRPLRGRRISWAEFRRLVGEPLRAINDNQCPAHNATAASK